MNKIRQYCVQTRNLETDETNLYLVKANNIYEVFKYIGLIPNDTDPNASYKTKASIKIEVLYSEPVD